ncbi:MAG: Trp family transcriptional regulator [Candidatus Peribacteraceae bacterium]
MRKPVPPRHLKELFQLLAAPASPQEAELLLKDLATPQELEAFAERWQLVKMLAKGITQREVARKLGVSISKVTRGSKWLQYGSGGFMHFLRKLKIMK